MTDEELEDIRRHYEDEVWWYEASRSDVQNDIIELVEALKEAREQKKCQQAPLPTSITVQELLNKLQVLLDSGQQRPNDIVAIENPDDPENHTEVTGVRRGHYIGYGLYEAVCLLET